MKMRGDICRIVNELSSGFLFPEYDFDVMVAYNLIFNYCKDHKAHPGTLAVSMDGYMLAINGKIAGRVVTSRKDQKKDYASISRAEGRILRRQENFYD